MAVEGKGFVVKDKRALDKEGELKDEKQEDDTKKEEAVKEEVKTDDAQGTPLPEVSFNSLIFSLSSSAFLHIGEIADPQSGEKKKDLPLAKHSIDIIAMLKEKTKGNLNEEEEKFVENILTDLRFRYVKAMKEEGI